MDQLFLISYQGTITTLGYLQNASPKESLCELASTRACEPNPSWISLDADRRIIYCTEGGMVTGKGTLKAFKIQPDGTLTEMSSIAVPQGAAHHIRYNNGTALAVAFYYSGYVGTYDLAAPTQVNMIQEMTFILETPGPGQWQAQARPHQIAIDPTGRFIFATDLGADLIRVFAVSADNQLKEIKGLSLPKGSYPRHVVLISLKEQVKLYVLLQELNAILVFTVTYGRTGDLEFTKDDEITLVRAAEGTPVVWTDEINVKASHIAASSDKKFLLVSVRGDASHRIPSPIDPRQEISSDSLLTYSIDSVTGALTFVQSAPSGGSTPRQFSLNTAGDKIAIVSQTNGWVSIFERDNGSGRIGKLLAVRDGFGETNNMGPVCIVWDTPKA